MTMMSTVIASSAIIGSGSTLTIGTGGIVLIVFASVLTVSFIGSVFYNYYNS